jgi:hypothetical protein
MLIAKLLTIVILSFVITVLIPLKHLQIIWWKMTLENGDWDTDRDCMSSGNQGPCWDAGDTLGWGKAPGTVETLAPWTASCGRLLHITKHWKNRWAATPMLPPPCRPTRPPPAGLPPHLLPATGGFQHHQMPAPNLPRRCRQTGLDAKGITTELLRLKFYCS